MLGRAVLAVSVMRLARSIASTLYGSWLLSIMNRAVLPSGERNCSATSVNCRFSNALAGR